MAELGSGSVVRESLVGDRIGLDAKAIVRGVVRESLVGDRIGLDAKALVRGVVRETLSSEPPSFGVAGAVAEYLIKMPALGIRSTIRELLTDGYTASVVIEQSAATFNLATSGLPVLLPPQVLSVMRSSHVQSKVVQAYPDNAFTWSRTRAAAVQAKVVSAWVQGLPVSFTPAGQATTQAVQGADVSLYPVPVEVAGPVESAQVFNLVVISTDIPYVPPSGAFVPQVSHLAVVQYVESLPLSYTLAGQSVLQVVQSRLDGMPISAVSAAQATSSVVQASDYGGMPVSPALAAAVVSRVVQTWQGPDPKVGEVDSSQAISLAVISADVVPFVGAVVNAQSIVKAVAGADYPPVDGLVALWVPQAYSYAVHDSAYPAAGDVLSDSRYAFANTMFSQQAPAAFYPDPDDMYQAAAGWFSPQTVGLATQRRPLAWPLSQTPTAQVLQNVTQRTPYPSPEEMLQQGVTSRLVVEQVAMVAEYPSTVMPDSDATVTLAVEQVAMVAAYPPAGTLYATVRASLAVEQVASSAEYADKGAVLSNASSSLITELVASVAVFGDKDAVLSYATGSQVIQQVTSVAAYLSKDDPQSFAVAGLIVGQAASVAEYPAKANVGSALTATLSVAQVMSRDLSLYGFPVTPRRRRPLVIARFVWN